MCKAIALLQRLLQHHITSWYTFTYAMFGSHSSAKGNCWLQPSGVKPACLAEPNIPGMQG